MPVGLTNMFVKACVNPNVGQSTAWAMTRVRETRKNRPRQARNTMPLANRARPMDRIFELRILIATNRGLDLETISDVAMILADK
jgi:hypothetical protein